MPLYQVICRVCKKERELFLKLAEFENLPECCGEMMGRVIVPTNIMPDIKPYKSMQTGEMIGSRSKHRNHLKEHNLIEIGNEKQIPPKPYEPSKKEKYELRREIFQRLDQSSIK